MRNLAKVALLLVAVGCGSGSDGGAGDGADNPQDPSGPDTQLPAPDGQPGKLEACKYMEVVFSLDNSSSMQEEKDAMANEVFPALAQALKQVGNGDVEFRASVLDACPTPPTFHTRGLGGSCDFFGDQIWMNDDSPALAQEFSCVANINPKDSACSGDNDDEQPASSIAAALEGDVNPGFLREKSLLVAVAITDEDEQPTPERSAQEVYDRIVALKGGDVMRTAFLGIGGATACDNGAYGSADEANKLQQITGLFGAQNRGLFQDLCQGRLENGLANVVKLIDQACDEFCNDPDGCDRGDYTPPPSGGECVDNADCPSGEYCLDGTCAPILD